MVNYNSILHQKLNTANIHFLHFLITSTVTQLYELTFFNKELYFRWYFVKQYINKQTDTDKSVLPVYVYIDMLTRRFIDIKNTYCKYGVKLKFKILKFKN